MTLRIRPEVSSSANSAALVPTSGPKRCGEEISHWSIRRMRNAPIVRGVRSSSRRSEPPNPGRSIATKFARSESADQVLSKAYRLSGQGK
jgi:hypothetical protein